MVKKNTFINVLVTCLFQVKLSVYKDGEEKHFIVFDGTGTDHVSWFSASKIVSSSWTDLSVQTFNHFSLQG